MMVSNETLQKIIQSRGEFALLYEFLNSLDLRHFQEQGAPHKSGDEIATVETLTFWLRDRKLLDPVRRLTRHIAVWQAVKVVDRSEETLEDGTIVQHERERFTNDLTLAHASGETAILR